MTGFHVLAWAASTTCGAPSKKLLLITLASYADEDWSCFPGQRTLAEVTELGERTVRRLLAEMEDDGLIRREHRQRADGSRTSDRFYLRPNGGHPTGQPVQANRPSTTGQPATVAGHSEPLEEPPAEPPASSPPPAGQLAMVQPAPAASPVPRGTGSLVGFDAFWEVFPLKQGKQAARRAWVKATRRAAPADIIAGAMRYRDDPNRDPEFTKMAQGWLSDGRWEDEPLPARRPQSTGSADVTMAAARRALSRTVANEPSAPAIDPGWISAPAVGGGS